MVDNGFDTECFGWDKSNKILHKIRSNKRLELERKLKLLEFYSDKISGDSDCKENSRKSHSIGCLLEAIRLGGSLESLENMILKGRKKNSGEPVLAAVDIENIPLLKLLVQSGYKIPVMK